MTIINIEEAHRYMRRCYDIVESLEEQRTQLFTRLNDVNSDQLELRNQMTVEMEELRLSLDNLLLLTRMFRGMIWAAEARGGHFIYADNGLIESIRSAAGEETHVSYFQTAYDIAAATLMWFFLNHDNAIAPALAGDAVDIYHQPS